MQGSTVMELLVTALLRGGIYSLVAVGLALVFGVMNVPSFAHGEFYMLGAYVAYFAVLAGVHPAVALVAAAASGYFLGAAVEKSLFYTVRLRSQEQWVMNVFLLTAGLSVVLQNLAQIAFGLKYRGITRFWPGRMQILSLSISLDRIVAFFVAVGSIFVFWVFLTRTRTGRAVRAVAQDEVGARLAGIDLNWIHNLTFSLSCMLAALAGGCLLSITPAYPTVGVYPLYKAWYVVILVGLGNVQGSILGGFIVAALETFSCFVFGAGWQEVIGLFIIMLVLLFKPSGILGTGVKSVWER